MLAALFASVCHIVKDQSLLNNGFLIFTYLSPMNMSSSSTGKSFPNCAIELYNSGSLELVDSKCIIRSIAANRR